MIPFAGNPGGRVTRRLVGPRDDRPAGPSNRPIKIEPRAPSLIAPGANTGTIGGRSPLRRCWELHHYLFSYPLSNNQSLEMIGN